METIDTKQLVSICPYCEKINDPAMQQFAKDVDDTTKKELAVVHQQVEANKAKYRFSHGICPLHFEQYLLGTGMNPERVKLLAQKKEQEATADSPTGSSKDLIHDNALRHAYMRGLFTPEEIKAAAQKVQQSNHALVERFQALSGIKSVYGDQ
jgi:hypothetical protein